jgi:ABC-type polysaccharide/polyol phosphate transport system ATPase subunit
LNDVSLQVRQGEILGLIGPNGAGKTTALSLLAGITAPTKGRVSVKGRVGALIQLGAGFHPDLTGRENIYLNGSILGLTRREIDRKFDSIVEFAGLDRFIDTPVKRYSSGMYVRLGFAVAAHIDPDVLLIDEVLAVGDAAFRQKCWKRIRELRESDATIVFVSHDMWAVQGLVDRAILLSAGRIHTQGDPGDVIEAYQEIVNQATYDHKGEFEPMTNLSSNYDSGAHVTISGARLLDKNGNERRSFQQGEEIVVEMIYVVSGGEEELEMELRIERSDGLSCSVSRPAHYGIRVGRVNGPGEFEVRISPLQLCSGSYVAYAMAVHPPPVSFEFCRKTLPFEITGPLLTDLKPGVYYPFVEWKHNGKRLEPVFDLLSSRQIKG